MRQLSVDAVEKILDDMQGTGKSEWVDGKSKDRYNLLYVLKLVIVNDCEYVQKLKTNYFPTVPDASSTGTLLKNGGI